MRIKLLVMCVAIAVCLANSSLAAFSFRAESGGAFSNSFIVPTTGASVALYLVDDTGGAFTSSSASYSLVRTAVNGVPNGFPTVGVTTGAPWNFAGVDNVNAPNAFQVSNAFFNGTVSSSLVNTFQAIRVGTFNFAGPAESSVTYNFRDIDGGNQVVVNGATIDSSVFANSGNFTITAIPEPSSMVLLGLVGVGATAVRRYRKKSKA